jgi:hypothetical protein
MRFRVLFLLFGFCIPGAAEVGVRVLLGITDKQAAKWDGSASIDRGRITKTDPWRFSKEDEILGESSWKASTAPLMTRTAAEAKTVVDNGVILWLTGEDENSTVQDEDRARGLQRAPGDIPYGKFATCAGRAGGH